MLVENSIVFSLVRVLG